MSARSDDARGGLAGLRVLVTNDDGVEAPGIAALALAAAKAGADVVVIAPIDNRSGASAAIGPIGRRRASGAADALRDLEVHALDAPPAVAVLSGCGGSFGAAPVAVLSGVNHGLNLGRVVLHSGTVGAALTAASMGLSGVAVSLEPSDEPDWDTAAELAVDMLVRLHRQGLPAVAVNLNVPAAPRSTTLVPVTLSRGGTARAAVVGDEFTFEMEVRSDAHDEAGSDAAELAAGRCVFTVLNPLATPPPDTWTGLVPTSD